jgi:GTPase SAR1 family protein
VIAGNKTDLNQFREVPLEEGKQYCASFHIPFFEVSAKAKIGVGDAFEEVVRQIIKLKQPSSAPGQQRKKKGYCSVM